VIGGEEEADDVDKNTRGKGNEEENDDVKVS
jgi:hypothetical protein